jgi:hypothetical protein
MNDLCRIFRGRVLISAPQHEALLDEFARSGLSAMAFRRLHGLVYPTFATWIQKRSVLIPARFHFVATPHAVSGKYRPIIGSIVSRH